MYTDTFYLHVCFIKTRKGEKGCLAQAGGATQPALKLLRAAHTTDTLPDGLYFG